MAPLPFVESKSQVEKVRATSQRARWLKVRQEFSRPGGPLSKYQHRCGIHWDGLDTKYKSRTNRGQREWKSLNAVLLGEPPQDWSPSFQVRVWNVPRVIVRTDGRRWRPIVWPQLREAQLSHHESLHAWCWRSSRSPAKLFRLSQRTLAHVQHSPPILPIQSDWRFLLWPKSVPSRVLYSATFCTSLYFPQVIAF